MNTNDAEIKEAVEAFVPRAPESYDKMIENTVSELREGKAVSSRPARRMLAPLAAAAAAAALLFVSASVLFGARPALAAEIPGLSGIVYAAASERTAGEADREKIEALLGEAFHSLALGEYGEASACFREGCIGRRCNYLSAAYLNRLLTFGERIPGGADVKELEIAELRAEKRAYIFTADVTLGLVSKDGSVSGREQCTVRIRENAGGMRIESIEMLSDGFEAYVSAYEAAFGAVPESGGNLCLIPIDNSCLSASDGAPAEEGSAQRTARLSRLLSELEGVSASAEEKALRAALIHAEIVKAEEDAPREALSVGELAAELMYRYWLGRKTGEVCGLSDIMERNEETDLFFWDAVLNAEKVSLGALSPLVSVEPGEVEVLEITDDTEEFIKARLYVCTDITDGVMLGVGEEIVLTLRKAEGGLMIVGFDREVGDGYYTYSLKPLALKYKKAGYSWQEAGRMAYEVVHAQLIAEAGA